MKKTLRKKAAICFCTAEMAVWAAFTSYGAWQADAGQWKYTPPGSREVVRSSWYQVDGQWYWFDKNGVMKTGWHLDPDGRWYFLNPISDGTKGRMVTGWQWIDGCCYYLSEETTSKYPQGAMYAGERTRDGYLVNKSGAWVKEDGSPVYQPGKGIVTSTGGQSSSKSRAKTVIVRSGGNSPAQKSQTMKSAAQQEDDPLVFDDKSWDHGDRAGMEADERDDDAQLDRPDTRGDPSDDSAEQVHWKIHFTDLSTHQTQLAPSKTGNIKEGENLTIYFQTKIIDGENRIWKSLQKSPYVITVTEPWDRVIYVEYEEMGQVHQEQDPWKEEKEHLQTWMELARKQEAAFLGDGQEYLDSRFLAEDKNSCDKRLKSAASRIEPGEKGAFYIIGKNYIPEGTALAKVYGDDMEYSNTVEDKITLDQDVYVLSRFQLHRKKPLIEEDRIWSPDEKQHWNLGDVQQRNLDGKVYRFRCIDQNYGDEADRSRQKALFLCESVIAADTGSFYSYEKQGDGTYGYTFYPGPVVSFGDSDSYKNSNIRAWLKQAEVDFEDAQEISTGVSRAYEGCTKAGGGGAAALSGQGLKSSYIGSQAMTDRLFILSVEDAIKYGSWLWTFDGAEEENPESQQSSFCKSYWLRNPSAQKGEEKVYVVDLIQKNIRCQDIKPRGDSKDPEISVTGTTGVRPAFTVRQR